MRGIYAGISNGKIILPILNPDTFLWTCKHLEKRRKLPRGKITKLLCFPVDRVFVVLSVTFLEKTFEIFWKLSWQWSIDDVSVVIATHWWLHLHWIQRSRYRPILLNHGIFVGTSIAIERGSCSFMLNKFSFAGSRCSCTNSIGHYGVVTKETAKCDIPCSEQPNMYCGGVLYDSVYRAWGEYASSENLWDTLFFYFFFLFFNKKLHYTVANHEVHLNLIHYGNYTVIFTCTWN